MNAIVIATKALTDSIGLAFTFFILMPALATGLIIVAKVTARGEKADDDRLAGRWGRRAPRSDD